MSDQTEVSTSEIPAGSVPARRQALSKRQIKAAEFAKSRITGQDEKIDSGVEKAKDFLGKLTDKPGEEPPADQPPAE